MIEAHQERLNRLHPERDGLRLAVQGLPPREDDRTRDQIQATAALNHVMATLLTELAVDSLSTVNQILTARAAGVFHGDDFQPAMQTMSEKWSKAMADILQLAPAAARDPRVSALVADNANESTGPAMGFHLQ